MTTQIVTSSLIWSLQMCKTITKIIQIIFSGSDSDYELGVDDSDTIGLIKLV